MLKTKLPQGTVSWGSLCVLFISLALIFVRDDIELLYIQVIGDWLNASYDYLTLKPSLNWLVALSVSLFGLRMALSIFKFRKFNLLVVLGCVVFLAYINGWQGVYLQIFSFYTYRGLLNILLTLYVGLEVYLLVKYVCRTITETQNSGLIILSPEYITDGRKVYAETISNLIINSPIRDKSFAVGITGEWGSGKTLVLSLIEEQLKDQAIVVQFKPWNSKSPVSLIDDFFSELRKGINDKNSNLGETISKYAARIIEIDINKSLSSFAKICSIVTKELSTLSNLRKEIEDLLVNLEKNVIVLIDDLDRLDSDELFETLRIIRNTADFKNVAYVVTYDLNYVSQMLNSKGIANYEHYLEKIFTTTVYLPTYEPHILVLLIYRELKRKYGEESIEFRGLSNYITLTWTHSSAYILNDYIKTYRDAIRFTNHIILDLEILKRNTATYFKDLNMKEWFYLELLKFCYPKQYSQLRVIPNDYLNLSFNSSQGFVRLKEKSEGQGGKKVLSLFEKILSLIFSNKQPMPYSIIYEQNYYNYFALRILNTEIKQSEFDNLFEDTALDMDYVLRLWRDRKPRVYKSVVAHFITYAKENCDKTQGIRFIRAMVKWSMLTQDKRMLSVIQNTSLISFKKEIQQEICESFFEELRASLPNISSLEYACKLAMASAPGPFDPSEDPDLPDRNLLSIDRAKKLAATILDSLLANNPHSISVDDLSVKGSNIRILLGSLTVETEIQGYPAFENYIIDYLIECIDNIISEKPETKGKNLKNFADQFAPNWTDNEEINQHIDEECRIIQTRLFSSSDNIRHIITDWFEADDAIKRKTIKNVLWYI